METPTWNTDKSIVIKLVPVPVKLKEKRHSGDALSIQSVYPPLAGCPPNSPNSRELYPNSIDELANKH